jgi:hypothetical protein
MILHIIKFCQRRTLRGNCGLLSLRESSQAAGATGALSREKNPVKRCLSLRSGSACAKSPVGDKRFAA